MSTPSEHYFSIERPFENKEGSAHSKEVFLQYFTSRGERAFEGDTLSGRAAHLSEYVISVNMTQY